MGGGYYERDVDEGVDVDDSLFNREGYTDEESGRRECHDDLDPKYEERECRDSDEHPETTPIVVAFDVTRSRGDDTKVIYEKLPLLIGEIIMKNYIEHPVISFCAIGDATAGDHAPLQVGQFESDSRLDELLTKIWIEEGGGGTGQESYELAAYFYANRSKLDSVEKRDKKGYFFFVGDEGFYPMVKRDQLVVLLGENLDDVSEDVPAEQAFDKLQELYHVYFVYPKKSWRARKADIDEEIKQRVVAAGGMHGGVDVRISLLWNNRNDLDLHVICPSGEEIYYHHNRSRCGGELDVDRNVRGETMKPVENVRWPKGEAPEGTYKVVVQNYGCHGGFAAQTPYRVEVDVNGEVKHFEGKTPRGKTGTQSDVVVYEFTFDPNAVELTEESDVYDNYKDEVIKDQWKTVLPEEHILEIEDPKGIIDVVLGALAMAEGDVDLDDYLVDMEGRGQTALRRKQTAKALEGLADTKAVAKVDASKLPGKKGAKKRKRKKTKRL